MEPVAVSSFLPAMEMVVTNYGMLSVRINTIYDKRLWGVKIGIQRTNRFYIFYINGVWKWIRGILGYFVQAGTIIYGNGRYIQSWATTINWKGVIKSVIKCPIVVFFRWIFLAIYLLWNSMTAWELTIFNSYTQCHCSSKSKISTLCHPIFSSARKYCRALLIFSILL